MKSSLKLYLSFIVLCTFYGNCFSQTPTYGDCLGALPICDSIYVEVISPNDAGNYVDEIHEDCCISNEQNSIWYTFQIKNSGSLGFTIIPEDPDYDYDWALFNITNKFCSDIANDFSLIASCNAAGGIDNGFNCYGDTGPNGGTTFDFQNANCGVNPPTMDSDGFSPLNDFVQVIEGEVYALLILEFTSEVPDGFIIDFTDGDDVGIYDEERPEIEEIEFIYDGCLITGFIVEFDEEIVCSSFEFADLNVVVSGVSNVTGTISSEGCDESDLASIFTVVLNNPVQATDTLFVSSNEDPYDLCFNPIFEFQFTQSGEFATDTIVEPIIEICADDEVELTEEISGQFSSIEWSTNENTETIQVGVGFFEATLTGDCGQRIVQYEVVSIPSPSAEIDVPLSICNESVFIDIISQEDLLFMINDGPFISEAELPPFEVGIHEITISDGLCDSILQFEVLEDENSLVINGDELYEIVSGDSVIVSVSTNELYDSIYWILDGTIFCIGCENIEVSPTQETVYTVIVVDENGCISSKEIIVRVRSEYDIYSPNIFSPNEDGINDRFIIFGNRFLENISLLEVYDRWGERVYQGVDLSPDNSNDGWDGVFKGKKVMPGVYSWIARVEYIDGFEQDLVGTVTVIR